MKTKITWAFILMAFAAMVSGCSASKRAAKHWHKSYRLDKETNAGLCASTYNPIDSIHENVIYKQGETMVLIDTLYDTVYNDTGSVVTKVITRTFNRVDTAAVTKYVQEVNNAKIVEQEEKHLKDLETKNEEIRGLATENRNLKAKLSAMEVRRDSWRKLAWIAWGIIALFFIIKFGIKWLKGIFTFNTLP